VTSFFGARRLADLFQLPLGPGAVSHANPFAQYGLVDNPFPAAGIDSGLLYSDHMVDELRRVNEWLTRVQRATEGSSATPVPPLALFGSLGVGKTHLLRYLERGLEQNNLSPVLRKGLADEGVTRLVLANLFLRYLPGAPESDEPGAGLVRVIVDEARRRRLSADRLLEALREGSPIETPFRTILSGAAEPEAIVWFGRWLRREATTSTQRMKLGLAGVLEGEGQAIRAVADLLRLAKAVGLIQIWFIMIDQLEELWREGVVTPSRRARFLTDLRFLIDQALEGAPIAVLLAWNTTTSHAVGPEVSAQMRSDYQALWERLNKPIDLPQLAEEHIWPFAETYLKAAGIRNSPREDGRRLYEAMKRSTRAVVEDLNERVRLAAFSSNRTYPPRTVLDAWRRRADDVANERT
jgi:hypothetical protein